MSETAAHATAEPRRGGVLVLGLGNVLLGDDGIGAAAVDCLERDYRIPPEVRLVEGVRSGFRCSMRLRRPETSSWSMPSRPMTRRAPLCGSMEQTSWMRSATDCQCIRWALLTCSMQRA